MSKAPLKRPDRFRGVPVRTMALNLILIATIFVTRDRWASWRLQTDLSGVPGVSHLAVTSDRERVALVSHAGDDAFCHIFDARTGEALASSRIGPSRLVDTGRPGPVYVPSSMISPDGTSFVVLGGRGPYSRTPTPKTGAETRAPFVVDAKTGERICVLGGLTLDVTCAAYSPDGKRIVTAAVDPDARVWDARTGECLLVLRGQRECISQAQFSPDGRRILTYGNDCPTSAWDAQTGKQLVFMEKVGGSVRRAFFCRGGRRVLTRRVDDRFGLWETRTGRVVAVLRGSRGFALHPGGQVLATADNENVVRLWDLESGRLTMEFAGSGGQGFLHEFRYLPGGRRLMTASSGAPVRAWDVRTWDVRTGGCVFAVHLGDVPVRPTPDGRRIVCPGAVHDASNGRLLARTPEWFDCEVIDNDRLLATGASRRVKGIIARVRPEAWWGVIRLRQFWVIAALAVALAWSGWRDVRKFRGPGERDDEGA